MSTLFDLAIFFIGTALGLPFGWWLCKRSGQKKIDAIDAQLKLNQAKMLAMVNANIRSRKNVR